MKKILLATLLGLISYWNYAQSKDTIRGKIISSVTFKKPIGDILISEKNSYDFIEADSLGYFFFIPEKKQSQYELVIMADNHEPQEFSFKSEWLEYKRPKHIVVHANCDMDKNKAEADWKNGTAKLYLMSGIVPVEIVKDDKRFKRKFDVTYDDTGCEAEVLECLIDYNQRIFLLLDIFYAGKWRKHVRNDVIGLN